MIFEGHTGTRTSVYKTSTPVYFIITSHEVIESCTDGVEMFFYIVCLFEEALSTVNEGIDVMEPFGHCVILEGEMSLQHELAKLCFIIFLMSLETWKCQILQT